MVVSPNCYVSTGYRRAQWQHMTYIIDSQANVAGEWIQLQLPSPIVLTSYHSCQISLLYELDGCGSLDGVIWYTVDTQTSQTVDSQHNLYIYSVSDTRAFSYFRLIVTKQMVGRHKQI